MLNRHNFAAIMRSEELAINSSKGVEGGGMTLRPYAIVSQAKQWEIEV